MAATCLVLAAAKILAQPSLKAVLRPGQEVQGLPGVTINSISGESARLGPQGHVISQVMLAGTGVGTTNDLAVVVARYGEPPRLVVREGDLLSGGGLPAGVTFLRPDLSDSISSLLVGPSGVVAFKALVNGLAPGASVILAGPAGNLSVVAFVNQAVSGEFGVNYVVTLLGAPRLNSAGVLAFLTKTRNPTNGSLLADIIWSGPPSNLSAALRTGVYYSGLTTADSTFGSFTLDGFLFKDEGTMLVHGTERYKIGVTNFTVSGLWLKNGNAVIPVAAESAPLPGAPGVTNTAPRSHPVTMSLANDGSVSFQSGLFGVGVTNGNDEAVFAGEFSGTSAATDLIARRGDPAPDESGAPVLPPFRWFGIFAPVGAAPGGVAVLRGEIVSGSSTNDYGVWLWNGTSLKLLAREGDPVRGLPANRWTFISQACVNPAGQIALSATLLANESAVVVYGAQGQFLGAIRKNDLVDMGNGTTNQVSSVQGLSSTGKLLNGSDGLGTQFNATGQLLVRLGAPNSILALYQSAGTGGATISGQVRRDLDADGDFNDAGDPGYANVTLELFADDGSGNPSGNALQTVRPAANGTYSFANVAVGSFLVKATVDTGEINNNGIAIRAPADGHRPVTVSGTQPVINVDFLVARVVTISGRVLDDTDGNERISDYDTGLPGVKVELFADTDGDGKPNDLIIGGGTVFTDPKGDFTFAVFDTSGGRYVVRQTAPPRYEPLLDVAGANDSLIPVSVLTSRIAVGNDFLNRREFRPRITLHRLIPSAVATANSDRVIEPTNNPAILAGLPEVARGLVADRMTPLIVRIHASAPFAGSRLELFVDAREGSVTDMGGSLMILRGDRWEPLANASSEFPYLSVDIYIQIPPQHPSKLVFQDFDSQDSVIQTFRLENPADGSVVSSRDVEFSWIPVALINDLGGAGWSAASLRRALRGRPPEFVRTFDFGSGFSRHAFESLRSDWAFTQFACVAHGRAANEVAELLDRRKYDWEQDADFLGLGWCRSFIPVGAPFAGSLLIPYLEGVKASGDLPAHTLAQVWYLDAVQGGVFSSRETRHPAATLDPSDSYFRRERISFVPCRSIAYGSVLVPGESPLLRGLGLSSPGVDAALLASDGVVTTNSMNVNEVETDQRYDPALQRWVEEFDHDDSVLEVPDEFNGICHGEPRALFGSNRTQTALDVMDRIMNSIQLQSGMASISYEIWTDFSFSERVIRAAREAGRNRFSTTAALAQPIQSAPLQGKASAAGSGPQTFSFQLDPPPGAPMTGDIEWLAMVFGGGATRTYGITVTPSNTIPPGVTVTVEDSVLGDIVLIGSYETTNGKRVIVEPRLVVSHAPEGVTMTNITLRPTTAEVGIGDSVCLEIYATFSDGAQLRRWLRPGEFTLANSNPSVLDVSDPFAWRALAPGTAQVTVTHGGFSHIATVVVADLFPKRTYTEWKEQNFSAAELANPQITGDAVDLDGDGLTTLFEYVTAGDPRSIDTSHHLRVEWQSLSGRRKPVVAARVSATITGYRVTLEQSGNLMQWEAFYTWTDRPRADDPAILDYSDFGVSHQIWFALPTFPAPAGQFYRLAVQAWP